MKMMPKKIGNLINIIKKIKNLEKKKGKMKKNNKDTRYFCNFKKRELCERHANNKYQGTPHYRWKTGQKSLNGCTSECCTTDTDFEKKTNSTSSVSKTSSKKAPTTEVVLSKISPKIHFKKIKKK